MSAAVGATFGAYFVILAMLGYVAWRRTSNLEDYVLGGRGLGAAVTALSAGASDMSGWLLLGLPGAVFVSGLAESWIVLGLVLGAYLNWRVVAPRLREFTVAAEQSVTLPEFLARRLADDSHAIRVTTTALIITFFAIQCQQILNLVGAEISQVMQCPLGTVKTWIHRARSELIRILCDRGIIEASGHNRRQARETQHAVSQC